MSEGGEGAGGAPHYFLPPQILRLCDMPDNSRSSNIESNKSQNGGSEDYNNISDGIFPHFTTPSIKISLG